MMYLTTYIHKLPIELLAHILEYDGHFRYRNGIFMQQIAVDDPRKFVLYNLPKIVYDKSSNLSSVELFITNYKYHILTYTMNIEKTIIDMHLKTMFNCSQFDTLLSDEYIQYETTQT